MPLAAASEAIPSAHEGGRPDQWDVHASFLRRLGVSG